MAFHKLNFYETNLAPKPTAAPRAAFCDTKLIVFGGFDGSNYLDTLHVLDLIENRWIFPAELSRTSRPTPRHLHCMEFLAPNLLVIFGGAFVTQFYNDTYVMNINTYSWEKYQEDEATIPSQRYGMASCVHAPNHMYIVGGYGKTHGAFGALSEQNLNDVWMFDARSRSWHSFRTVGEEKPEGINLKAVYHRKKLIVLGDQLFKIFILNLQNREWSVTVPSGTVPDRMSQYSLTMLDTGAIYMFGGASTDELKADTFSLEMHDDQFVWNKLECTGNKPEARYDHCAINLGETMLIIGGRKKDGLFDDYYAFNPAIGLRWICLRTEGDPPPERVGHGCCFIPKFNSILIHGGDVRGVVSNDLHFFHYSTRTWESVYTEDSPALAFHSFVYDRFTHSVLVYGGGDLNTALGDFHILNLDSMQWSTPKLNREIPARVGHCAFMHPKMHAMIVVGGFVPREGYVNEVWRLDLEQMKWYICETLGKEGAVPVGRIAMTCSLVKKDKKWHAIMLGGINSEIALNDVWTLNLGNWEWNRLSITGRTPGQIYGHSASIVDESLFVYAGEVVNSRGEVTRIPTKAVLWSLKLNSTSPYWSRYKVEGSIPPKIFHSSVTITNDIIIFGGGPDNNIYQLDRNDIPNNAESDRLFSEFIMPYKQLPLASFLESSSQPPDSETPFSSDKSSKPRKKKGKKVRKKNKDYSLLSDRSSLNYLEDDDIFSKPKLEEEDKGPDESVSLFGKKYS